MRCWNPDCRKLITIPEIVNGEPGKPGQIRQLESAPAGATDWAEAGVTAEFTCPHCGTGYRQVTNVTVKRDKKRDRRSTERGDGWD